MYLCRPKDGKKGIEVGVIFWEKIFEVLERQETESKTCQFLNLLRYW